MPLSYVDITQWRACRTRREVWEASATRCRCFVQYSDQHADGRGVDADSSELLRLPGVWLKRNGRSSGKWWSRGEVPAHVATQLEKLQQAKAELESRREESTARAGITSRRIDCSSYTQPEKILQAKAEREFGEEWWQEHIDERQT